MPKIKFLKTLFMTRLDSQYIQNSAFKIRNVKRKKILSNMKLIKFLKKKKSPCACIKVRLKLQTSGM